MHILCNKKRCALSSGNIFFYENILVNYLIMTLLLRLNLLPGWLLLNCAEVPIVECRDTIFDFHRVVPAQGVEL